MSIFLSLRSRWSLVFSCFVAGWGGLAAVAQDGSPPTRSGLVIEREFVIGEEQAKHWIGVAVHPADAELRAKWKIEGDAGLVVDQVIPDSPAAKAGLQVEDVIVTVGDAPAEGLEPLAKAVAKGKELALHIVRGGKRSTIMVQPAKRPENERIIVIPEGKEDEKAERGERGDKGEENEAQERQEHQMRERLEQLLKTLRAGATEAANPAGSATPAGALPGAPAMMQPRVLMARTLPQAGLPDDMQVIIAKRGKQPATITVKQGQKLWRTTEAELEMLPAEARGYVAQALGRPAAGAMPGAAIYSVEPQRGAIGWQQLNRPGKVELTEPRRAEGVNVKQLPGGGIQLEIREGAPSREKPERGEKQAESK